MGPPPPVSRSEMLKNIVSQKDKQQTQPRRTSSEETTFSESLSVAEKTKWHDSTTSSKRPKIVQIKDSEGKTILVQEIEKDVMMFLEYHLKEFYWSKEDKLDRPLSPISRDWRQERLERGERSVHKALANPIVRLLKVDPNATPDRVGGIHEQNKYTLLRKDGSEQKITDGDLFHPLDIIMLKKTYDQDKGNTRFIRRSLHSLTKAGVKLFERVALSDFDLCINFDYVHSKKVHLPPPNTSITAELEEDAKTGVIFEKLELSVVFRDIEEKKAPFEVVC
ncbi:hypothetical protein Hanom_Chr13g01234291 [Helianthus anomalus]